MSLLLWAAACGRLGYDLLEADAGTRESAQQTESSQAEKQLIGFSRTSIGASPALDAGAMAQPPTAAVSQPPDAGSVAPSGQALAIGQACDSDQACTSGACVSGMCCESHCAEPGPCQSAAGATCSDGRCVFTPLEDGATCDDANLCTTGDRCYRGYCFGMPRDCDDGEDCTSDFCTAGTCMHASSCDPEADGCSYGLNDQQHGYWTCPAALSFDDAEAQCARIGSHLATVNDADEQKYLWGRGMRDTWIGYRAASKSKRFEWISGNSQYADWADGVPDASMDRCAYLSAAHGGAWDSHACHDDASGYACEIEDYAPPDAGCSYLRGFGQGYFICSGPRVWADAQRYCQKIGAKLAEIGNGFEQGYLATYLESGMRYAIGLHDRMQSGHFAWDTGDALTFTAWDDMQPMPVSRGTSYVAMDGHSGLWSTLSGFEAVGFVCEQKR